jgi:hypothetical protein
MSIYEVHPASSAHLTRIVGMAQIDAGKRAARNRRGDRPPALRNLAVSLLSRLVWLLASIGL